MNPVMPSSLRACSTASHHLLSPLFLNFLRCTDEDFLETILPCLLIIKSFLVSPPEVYILVPFQTWRLEPVWDFLVILFGFFDFLADFERDLDRRLEALRLLLRLLERFFDLLLGARGLLAVLRRDLEREDFLLEPLGAAERRRFLEDRLLDRDFAREVDIERDLEAARGLLAVRRRDLECEDFLLEPLGAAARRRFLDDRLLDRERDREVDIERDLEAERGLLAVRRFLELRDFLEREVDREELFLGARGAAARRRAFRARRRDALLFLDFFGARGLLAVRRRDFERDFLAPRGAAARRRFLEDRLLDRDLEREVDAERDLEAARGLLAVRRFFELRDFLEREVDREEQFLGARGAAARRRAFRARRRDALLFLDFFGARGLLAVRRRDFERDFLAPRGAAARRRFVEERLLD